jgi:hypothetical protein
MTKCCLPSHNTMQVDGQTQVAVTCDPLELVNFLKRDFLPMNLMCERAEMFERPGVGSPNGSGRSAVRA